MQGSAAGFFDGAGNPLAGTLEREAEGEDRTTRTRTQDWGATLQLSHKGKIFGRGNRVTVGVAYDGHQTRFTQREADAELVPDARRRGHAADRRLRDGGGRPHPASRTSAST